MPRLPKRTRFLFVLAALFAAHSVTAQSDNARLVVGIHVGWVGSTSLWEVPNQPVIASTDPGNPAIYQIIRSTHPDLTASAQVSYFGTRHVGWTVEFSMLGLGNEDNCTLVHDTGNPALEIPCEVMGAHAIASAAGTLTGGIVLRTSPRSGFRTFVRATAGLAFTPTSTLALASYPPSGAVSTPGIEVYTDDHWSPIRPCAIAALGVSTLFASPFQLHVEIREAVLPLPVATGPSDFEGMTPPHATRLKALPSLLMGFDLQFGRSHETRY